ncbi:tyrosine-type recombinase/integrase [Aeromonas hydrophila]|uniref:integrase domain-containing protein n=1 Tax=Aeromonas hydrophila TaxID=644 RepID=UPI001B3A6CA6|nr:tyrosine-type recombinase/integrase [Aeromonas hydrophila]MBW3814132.1 tyrosine-type recombinase/integrase [Aeromonas hydrophila]MCF7681169.1 tyrosine-type recombinase/integrase [Aeromonas hydrophila]MCF7694077.1 tyrosine-type recombinase/integrase [Aeromonas hydrophila]MCF7774948.1 tyrosine-type recombinase/integrase [Aeromonas hydrophila]
MSKDKLTDSKLRTAKPEAKEYSLGDGDGLYLRVKPNGARLWVFNYYRPSDKKRANISFGPYPDVTLAAARERRREARALLAQAIDPKRHKEEQIAFVQAEQEANANTFERMAAMWLELKRHDVSEAYADDSWRSLELYVLPFIGSMPINQIRAPKVIEMLRPIEADGKHETVRRLCQRINEILDYSVNHGLLDANPCAAIRKVFKKPSKKHMPTLKPTELPMLMADIANGRLDHTTRCQIEWSLHTLVRPGESAGTRWDEIDFEGRVWNIPADRMKMDRPHRVPLTSQALSLLERMKPISGHRPYVFPGYRDPLGHINNQSANAALKRLGYGGRLVAHGLRSLGSTTLNEQGFNPDAIEAALSHSDENEIRRAYNRTDYFEQRVIMMDWWSKHIEQASQGNLSLAICFQIRQAVNE